MTNLDAYLYGIIPLKNGEIKGCEGIGEPGLGVFAVPVEGVSFLVSYLPKNFKEVEIDDAVKHVKVLEQLMDDYPVIPVKFGTVVKSFDHLKPMMRKNRSQIKSELKRLTHKYEVGIKAYWKKDFIQEQLKRVFEDLPVLQAQVETNPEAAVELGKRAEELINTYRDNLLKLHRHLAQFTTDDFLGEPMSVEMVYNGSFLVDSEQDSALKQHLEAYADKNVEKYEFHFTTHLPPYNFVEIELNLGGKS